MTKVYPFQ